jgi:DNA-binding XRE family transcriptional regulator
MQALTMNHGGIMIAKNKTRSKAGRPRSAEICEFGRRIESMAAKRGMDRRQLAKEAGVTYAGLWSVLVGRTKPSLATALKLSGALHVPIAKLVG